MIIKRATEKVFNYAKDWIVLLNRDNIEEKEEVLNGKYITKENGIFIIDENLITYDLRNYKLAMSTYSSVIKLNIEQEKAGFESENLALDIISTAEKLKRNKNAKTKFKDAFNEYAKIQNEYLDNKFNLISKADNERIALDLEAYPIIKDAYNLLGVEGVEELSYHQTNIKNRLIALSDIGNENKIARILAGSLSVNMWYSLKKYQRNYTRCL